MGTPYLVMIIQDVDLAFKALEIVYRTNGGELEGLADSNEHRRKVLGEGGVSVWEVHGPKVRGMSAKSPKRCYCTVIF